MTRLLSQSSVVAGFPENSTAPSPQMIPLVCGTASRVMNYPACFRCLDIREGRSRIYSLGIRRRRWILQALVDGPIGLYTGGSTL